MKYKNCISMFAGLVFVALGNFALAQTNTTDEKTTAGNQAETRTPTIKLVGSQDGKAVDVTVDGEKFTTYEGQKYAKPILYPVYAHGNVPMTRNYPMVAAEGEARDHPHHMSIWIGHEVNHLDFWTNKSGKIRFCEIESIDEQNNAFSVRHEWVDPKQDGAVILTEKTKYQFGADDQARWIDARISFVASHGEVLFNDTKEGLFAIRTHPLLRLKANPKQGVPNVTGKAINSSGTEGTGIWGKPAKWVSYWGTVDQHPVGIAILDHPTNLRHPTTWHAREYGLITANPFGLYHFTGAKKGTGEVKLAKGETLNLRYRIVFYTGAHDKQRVEDHFAKFAAD